MSTDDVRASIVAYLRRRARQIQDEHDGSYPGRFAAYAESEVVGRQADAIEAYADLASSRSVSVLARSPDREGGYSMISKELASTIAYYGLLRKSEDQIRVIVADSGMDPDAVVATIHDLRQRATGIVASYQALASRLEDFRLIVEADYGYSGRHDQAGLQQAADLARSVAEKGKGS